MNFQSNHWALLDLKYYYLDDGFQLVATTDVPCHLYCRMSTTPPRKHVLPAFRRGIYLQGDVRFCFVVFEDNEQDEAGDTLTHTWHKTGWPVCETRWFYFVGTQGGTPSVSETAIFKLHFTGPRPPVYLYTSGPGDEANIPREYPADTSHWLCVHDLRKNAMFWRVMSDGYMTWYRDLYTIDALDRGTFNSLNIRSWGFQSYSYHRYRYHLKIPTMPIWTSAEYGWPPTPGTTPQEGKIAELLTNPITGRAWAHQDLNELQLGVSLNEKGTFGAIYIQMLYIEVVGFHAAGV
ncbi:hypothetical protein ES703_56203 [subsurface metagenome]